MAVLIYPSTLEQNTFDINCPAGNKGSGPDWALVTASLKRRMSSSAARDDAINFAGDFPGVDFSSACSDNKCDIVCNESWPACRTNRRRRRHPSSSRRLGPSVAQRSTRLRFTLEQRESHQIDGNNFHFRLRTAARGAPLRQPLSRYAASSCFPTMPGEKTGVKQIISQSLIMGGVRRARAFDCAAGTAAAAGAAVWPAAAAAYSKQAGGARRPAGPVTRRAPN